MAHEIFIKSGTSKEVMSRVSELLKSRPGEHQVSIALETGNNMRKITLPYKIDFTPELEKQVAKILNGW